MVQKFTVFVRDLFLKSLVLDYMTLKTGSLNYFQKADLLFKKYPLIIKFLFLKNYFEAGKTKTKLFGNDHYFDSRYGLAGIQTAFTSIYNHLAFLKNQPSLTVIDIGANVGNFSLLVSTAFDVKKLISIEPIPDIYNCLVLNTKNIKNITTINCAICDEIGSKNMSFDKEKGYLSRFTEDVEQSVIVDTLTLDNIIETFNISKVDLLKIDVEGFENLVLDGAKNNLKNIKYIMIEMNLKDNPNYTISSIFSKLYSSDFDFEVISINTYGGKFENITITDFILENRKFIK
jgi:FkbM family methyltransferase